jgi:chorismate synthase
MLQFHTAGESHGKALVALVEGFPAGLTISPSLIDDELRRRQGGSGRGGRQQIESDRVEILSGVWRGVTIGSPVALLVANKDCKLDTMDEVPCPRPGHGDLSGAVKHFGSVRGVLERASARTTAARVVAGALTKQLLEPLGITVFGYVTAVGPIAVPLPPAIAEGPVAQQRAVRARSRFYTLDPDQDPQLERLIDDCRGRGDTLGGLIEVCASGVPFGLGSHSEWDRRLDGRLAQAVMSIPAMKGVEIGMGFDSARRPGSEVHDPIFYDPALRATPTLGFRRPTNHAGGLEAGMSTSQPIVLRVAMKPLPTLAASLPSVDLQTLQSSPATYQRSDVCAIAAASCIVENVVAFEIARAVVDKFGGDSFVEIEARWRLFHEMARERFSP